VPSGSDPEVTNEAADPLCGNVARNTLDEAEPRHDNLL